MHVRILGSAAGGGVPQWNCRCPNCENARGVSASGVNASARPTVRSRTQSSVAVSADGHGWWLLNASPDIRQQILAFPPLGPPPGVQRGQGIRGCLLTDAEIDHTAGLLFLREGSGFSVVCTPLVRGWLNRYLPLEPLLDHFAKPAWTDLPLDAPLDLSGLVVRAFAIDRHVPRFVQQETDCDLGSVIGLSIHDPKTNGRLLYAPCVGSLSEDLVRYAQDADAILMDGTFWSDCEPLGIGKRTALAMGHMPVSGPEGSLAWLAKLRAGQRIYVHINNTNPMLDEAGAEHRRVREMGVLVGADGDAFEL